jgi:hypothetical protein
MAGGSVKKAQGNFTFDLYKQMLLQSRGFHEATLVR